MKSWKKTARQIAPRWFVKLAHLATFRLALWSEYREDKKRYLTFSGPDDWAAVGPLPERNLEAQITKDYHRIEKGLALASPKRPFGDSVLERLDRLIPVSGGAEYREYAESARRALLQWNTEGTVDDEVSPPSRAGDRGLRDPDAFFGSRHSVRDFSTEAVSEAELQRAVELAMHTPSVCNRQSWIIRLYKDPESIKQALRFQNGNAGMEVVPALALITVDSRLFTGPSERNQGFIEGGLFSMSFGWALHAIGLDSVMLNLSISTRRMSELRRGLSVPEHEMIIMMTAIGRGRPGHRVARSPRRRASDIVR